MSNVQAYTRTVDGFFQCIAQHEQLWLWKIIIYITTRKISTEPTLGRGFGVGVLPRVKSRFGRNDGSLLTLYWSEWQLK